MIRPVNKKMRPLAVIAFVLFFFFAVSSALGVLYAESGDYYSDRPISYYNSPLCYSVTDQYSNMVFEQYFQAAKSAEQSIQKQNLVKDYEKMFSPENTNFFFTITDRSGTVVLSNYIEQTYGMSHTKNYGFFAEDKSEYTLHAFVKDPISAEDNYVASLATFNFLYNMRYSFIVLLILSGIASVFFFVYLVRTAGYSKDAQAPSLSAIDRIPLDIFILGTIGLFSFFIAVVSSLMRYNVSPLIEAVVSALALLIFSLLFLAICMTLSVRIKTGKWWRNTLTFYILRWIKRVFMWLINAIKLLLIAIPLIWKVVLGTSLFLIIDFVLINISFHSITALLLFALFNGAVFILVLKIALQIYRLKEASNHLAQGDYDKKVQLSPMFAALTQIGNNLNNISLGMQRAVEQQLKGERLKAELITNVSHDIKTPLTSIVNYVDLLKKENIQTQPVAEYIAVLDRQSARLKKLTEDVLEASKVSTGNVSLSPTRLNVIELLSQSLGEYSEKFKESDLTLISHFPSTSPYIFADGRLLWRTFDNLLNNICKYAQPKTRVYVEADADEQHVLITFKNISTQALNISSDELIERFVRGDSARTTEGSGLGLSIAKSLVELQKGTMQIQIDGDLFKVQLSFALVC